MGQPSSQGFDITYCAVHTQKGTRKVLGHVLFMQNQSGVTIPWLLNSDCFLSASDIQIFRYSDIYLLLLSVLPEKPHHWKSSIVGSCKYSLRPLSPGSKWYNQPHSSYQLNQIRESLDSGDLCSEDRHKLDAFIYPYKLYRYFKA